MDWLTFWLCDPRWLTEHNIFTKPVLHDNFVLDWDIDFKFLKLFQEVATKKFKIPKITGNYRKWSVIDGNGHNFVLDWDIDFNSRANHKTYEVTRIFQNERKLQKTLKMSLKSLKMARNHWIQPEIVVNDNNFVLD